MCFYIVKFIKMITKTEKTKQFIQETKAFLFNQKGIYAALI